MPELNSLHFRMAGALFIPIPTRHNGAIYILIGNLLGERLGMDRLMNNKTLVY